MRPVGHEATRVHKPAQVIHGRQAGLGREFYDPSLVRTEHWVPNHDQGLDTRLVYRGKGTVDLVRCCGLEGEQCDAQGWGCRLERLHLARARGVGWIEEDGD